MSLKKIIGKLHLVLGLTSGLLVVVIALTGCIYAFQVEISDMTQPYRFIEPSNREYLLPSAIQTIAEKALPGHHAHSVTYDKREGRAAQVVFYEEEPKFYYTVYVDPYTGEVRKAKDMYADFFRFILDGHFYLWLPDDIGQPVVASASLIFLLMMISGLFLWWPRHSGAAKERFMIRWSARWRRKNYDLHNVLGFYMTWVGIILAITGLVWGFTWFADGLYWITSGGKTEVEFYEPVSDVRAARRDSLRPVDSIWQKMINEYPDAEAVEVHYPETDSSSIAAGANPDAATYWQYDYRYFDQHTLKELSVRHIYGRFDEGSFADKLKRMNYDLHVGSVIGLPGKILAFCGSLIVSTLPVTGFMIWRGRRKSKEGKSKER